MGKGSIPVVEQGQFQGVSDKKIEKHRGGQMDDKIHHMIAEHVVLSDIPVKGKAEVCQRPFDPFGINRVLRFQKKCLFQGCETDLV